MVMSLDPSMPHPRKRASHRCSALGQRPGGPDNEYIRPLRVLAIMATGQNSAIAVDTRPVSSPTNAQPKRRNVSIAPCPASACAADIIGPLRTE